MIRDIIDYYLIIVDIDPDLQGFIKVKKSGIKISESTSSDKRNFGLKQTIRIYRVTSDYLPI